jgi:hypothetical protein
VTSDESQIEKSKEKELKVCEELQITPMTPQQIKDKIIEINTKHWLIINNLIISYSKKKTNQLFSCVFPFFS